MKEAYRYFFIHKKNIIRHYLQFKIDVESIFEELISSIRNGINKLIQKEKMFRDNLFNKSSALLLVSLKSFNNYKKRLLINTQSVVKKLILVKSLVIKKYGSTRKIKLIENITYIKNDNVKTLKQGWIALRDLGCKITFIGLGAFLSVALTSTSVANEGPNPFDPIFNTSSGSSAADYIDSDSSVHPLQQQAVKSYTLMALIASKDGNIAMVKTKNGEEFFVKINDKLGNADGKITSINKRGIEVNEKDRVVSLLVRNRSMSNEKTE
ncbi:MAG TPA: hypothetical protein EYP92_00970 [Candidatus Thioglobus sp.]|jgi:hypothetical protein|nr:hypothetical protein [Candidatus Thioglobus sp.]HIK76545.1 hypothetical protein [Gammaproteobacteria bacterium]